MRSNLSQSTLPHGDRQSAVDSRLKQHLSAYLGAGIQHWRKLASGWQTDVFEFEVPTTCKCGDLPTGQPLVLKIYGTGMAVEKCGRETWTMRRLKDAGYPTSRPYLFETDREPLGAPFMIMERLKGRPLFAFDSIPRAAAVFAMGIVPFAKAHAALHSLSAQIVAGGGELRSGEGSAERKPLPLLDRMLATIAERIEQTPLPALKPALECVSSNAARFRGGADSVLHLDYHPQNVIVEGVRVSGVTDWLDADVGDRHLDTSITAVILRTSATGQHGLLRDHAAANTLRTLCAAMYLAIYHSILPLDRERFRYCQSVAALHRLAMFSMMRARGAESAGFRQSAMAEVTPAVLRLLARRVARLTGVPVSPHIV